MPRIGPERMGGTASCCARGGEGSSSLTDIEVSASPDACAAADGHAVSSKARPDTPEEEQLEPVRSPSIIAPLGEGLLTPIPLPVPDTSNRGCSMSGIGSFEVGSFVSSSVEGSDQSLGESSCATRSLTMNKQGFFASRSASRLRSKSPRRSLSSLSGKQNKLLASDEVPRSQSLRMKTTVRNGNVPADYAWLESVLDRVASNRAQSLRCTNTTTGEELVPVFLVLGGCPNTFCGMQAVMYCANPEGRVDFWWIKPSKNSPQSLETSTLNRHAKGPHKNDPGRSTPFYKPIADLFQDSASKDGWRFGMESRTQGVQTEFLRAFIEPEMSSKRERYYWLLVWQEDWTTNPFAWQKYIRGKIFYQKDVSSMQFFSRQYFLSSGQVSMSNLEEGPFHTLLPSDSVKQLRD